MIYNKVKVAFGSLRKATAPAIPYQYDVVQKLIIKGLELPEYYQVDFCNDGDTSTITMVGTADGVDIPDQFLQTGRNIKAYLVITGTDEGAAETRYEIVIPVNKRPARTDIEPTPVEQSTIDSLVDALNDGVTRSESAAEHAEVSEANSAESEANAKASELAAKESELNAKQSEIAAHASQTAAEASQISAAESERLAKESEQNAETSAERAEQAATNAGYMFIEMDGNGHLIYTRTDAVDVTFNLNSVGHLILEGI